LVEDFIAGLKLPLETPLISSPPRLRVSRMRDDNWVSRRSVRLAAMSAFRDRTRRSRPSESCSANGSRRRAPCGQHRRRLTRPSPLDSTRRSESRCRRPSTRHCWSSTPLVPAGGGACAGTSGVISHHRKICSLVSTIS
jgi:hypothetical protein